MMTYLIICIGRLADILGRKGSMLLALSLFGGSALLSYNQNDPLCITGLGTIWCGMAGSMNLLIAGRIVAGMGGGG